MRNNDINEVEIRQALFSMKEGLHQEVEFFKQNLALVGEDVQNIVSYSFKNNVMPSSLNSTILTVVPKVAAPARIKEYKSYIVHFS